MNTHFVNIKVDREERPDLDAIYQSALQLMGEHGGWPLTMFLTAEGEPFWGGTYFPPEPRYGRPGFPQVLTAISNAYANDPESVAKNVASVREALHRMSENATVAPSTGLDKARLDAAAATVTRYVDFTDGGISGAPKFPNVPIFLLLWRAYLRTGNETYRDAVLITLERMSRGGIYDHLGGGYARYSTDQIWLAPHFEKMLYDNSQLIELLTLAWQKTSAPMLAERVEETVGWLHREMILPGGGFASTLDADSEGKEGTFYVWIETEIDEVLGEASETFKKAYDVTPRGNWEGVNILNRTNAPAPMDADTEALLAACRTKLLEARARRIRPGLDDKVLADWSGMMVASLANAGIVFDRPDWIAAAKSGFNFVISKLGDGDRLGHSWCQGQVRGAAVLDDYVQMARGALALYSVTGEPSYVECAVAWVRVLDARFRDPGGAGYFYSADDTDDVILRTKTAVDNAIPAGNGVMVEVLATLYHLTGKDRFRAEAETLAAALVGDDVSRSMAVASALNGYERLVGAAQVVIVSQTDDDNAATLIRAALDAAHPDLILSRVSPGLELAPGHPAHGKSQVNGRATAYVCQGQVCGPPVTDPPVLSAALTERLA
jgi:uncharacterized protein YyaL (SSP411 family)